MKDWLKIIISIVAGIIITLIGAYVQLSLNSVYRDIDRIDAKIIRLECEQRDAIGTIHKRITDECDD